MSGIVEMRDGYGWTGGTLLGREGGATYYTTQGDAGIVKTIYVAEQKISPVYIFWQVRLYNNEANVVDYVLATSGLISDYTITSSDVANTPDQIASLGSVLLTVEGYTILSSVTAIITCVTVSDIVYVYPMSETGV